MRIAVVGTGQIAQAVAPHLAAWGFEVVAVCGTPRSAEKTRELAARVGGEPFDDYATLLSQTSADVVYLAVPNDLHHDFALAALRADKDVLVEKPFASTYEQACEMAACAHKHGRLVYEAVTTPYQPGYARLAELLPQIGDVRLATINYSQYSSRYDAFAAGVTPAAFDPARSGGALMDLGLYNAHLAVGLLGEPASGRYLPHMERGIDTSGVLEMGYDGYSVLSVAAKDCAAPCGALIQGSRGYLTLEGPANARGRVRLHLNDGFERVFEAARAPQWEALFTQLARRLASRDAAHCECMLERTLAVSRLITSTRRAAGITFAADGEGRP